MDPSKRSNNVYFFNRFLLLTVFSLLYLGTQTSDSTPNNHPKGTAALSPGSGADGEGGSAAASGSATGAAPRALFQAGDDGKPTANPTPKPTVEPGIGPFSNPPSRALFGSSPANSTDSMSQPATTISSPASPASPASSASSASLASSPTSSRSTGSSAGSGSSSGSSESREPHSPPSPLFQNEDEGQAATTTEVASTEVASAEVAFAEAAPVVTSMMPKAEAGAQPQRMEAKLQSRPNLSFTEAEFKPKLTPQCPCCPDGVDCGLLHPKHTPPSYSHSQPRSDANAQSDSKAAAAAPLVPATPPRPPPSPLPLTSPRPPSPQTPLSPVASARSLNTFSPSPPPGGVEHTDAELIKILRAPPQTAAECVFSLASVEAACLYMEHLRAQASKFGLSPAALLKHVFPPGGGGGSGGGGGGGGGGDVVLSSGANVSRRELKYLRAGAASLKGLLIDVDIEADEELMATTAHLRATVKALGRMHAKQK